MAKFPFSDVHHETRLIFKIKNLTDRERVSKLKSYITNYKSATDVNETISRMITDLCVNYSEIRTRVSLSENLDMDKIDIIAFDFIRLHYPEFSLEVLSHCINTTEENLDETMIEFALTYPSVETYMKEVLSIDVSVLSIPDTLNLSEDVLIPLENMPNARKESKKAKAGPNKEPLVKNIDLSKVRREVKSVVRGQDHVVDIILEKLSVMAAGLRSFSNLYLMGKSGVGKSLTAKQLAKAIFGDANKLIHVDCAAFKHDHDDSKIFGAGPGYIGYGEDTVLMKAAKESNAWIILFDEFEKSGPSFQDTLLRLLDEGRIVAANGKELDFSNSLFLFTSNLGTDKVSKEGIGLIQHNYSDKELREQFINELKKKLKPEFSNRLREIVVFNELKEDCIKDIIKDHLSYLPIKVTVPLINYVLKEVDYKMYGARDVTKKIESLVEPALSIEMLRIKDLNKRKKAIFTPKVLKGKLSFVKED
jgi:DNA polymerase III delta prime subunit